MGYGMAGTDFATAAERYSDRPAVLTPDGEVFTWREMFERASALEATMAELGVGTFDGLAFQPVRTVGWLAVLMKSHGLAPTRIPLHPELAASELDAALASLRPDWFLEGVEGDGVVGLRRLSDAGSQRLTPWPFDPDTPFGDYPYAAVLTSGTTGRPRGVVVTDSGMSALNSGAARRLELGPDDVWSLYLSPAHVGGLALIHRAAFTGAAIHLPERFSARGLLKDAANGLCTHASLVPTMLSRLVDHMETERAGAPERLRCLLVGGAGTPSDLLDRAMALNLPIALTYGLSQASSQVATATPDQVRLHPGSVGAPLPKVEVRIHEPDPEGVGEIQVRGPTVARAYVGSDEPLLRDDGWLATGDLGRLDDEGRLWVRGRVGRRIISGGVNVEPQGVESFLRSIPGVRDAAVVGLPDPEWGERVAALVVLDPASPLTAHDILGACREGLQPAHRPRVVAVGAEIPLNPNGKVDLTEVSRVLEPVEESAPE